MSVTVRIQESQSNQQHRKIIESALKHVEAASRLTECEDLRYFDMKDLQQVRINLHLAQELLHLTKII